MSAPGDLFASGDQPRDAELGAVDAEIAPYLAADRSVPADLTVRIWRAARGLPQLPGQSPGAAPQPRRRSTIQVTEADPAAAGEGLRGIDLAVATVARADGGLFVLAMPRQRPITRELQELVGAAWREAWAAAGRPTPPALVIESTAQLSGWSSGADLEQLGPLVRLPA